MFAEFSYSLRLCIIIGAYTNLLVFKFFRIQYYANESCFFLSNIDPKLFFSEWVRMNKQLNLA